jgi:hypothetical protein
MSGFREVASHESNRPFLDPFLPVVLSMAVS